MVEQQISNLWVVGSIPATQNAKSAPRLCEKCLILGRISGTEVPDSRKLKGIDRDRFVGGRTPQWLARSADLELSNSIADTRYATR